MLRFITLLIVICLASACASNSPQNEAAGLRASSFAAGESMQSPQLQKRQVIKTSSMTLTVRSLEEVSNSVVQETERFKGIVESTNQYDEKRINIRAKVPSGSLDNYVEALSVLGRVTAQSTSSRDVTEQIVDYDAKLKNLFVLRDRYRQLLDRAEKVSEIVDIERELNKVQTQIDSIEGWRASLMGQVAMSSVNVTLEQETIYGPLGYLGKGILWAVGKLFVIK